MMKGSTMSGMARGVDGSGFHPNRRSDPRNWAARFRRRTCRRGPSRRMSRRTMANLHRDGVVDVGVQAVQGDGVGSVSARIKPRMSRVRAKGLPADLFHADGSINAAATVSTMT